ncbi:hypothetical protein JTE90_013399 [Oedothorax gibbosus]|uniref:Nucleocapsid protein n=1 Tax=Oedothorax gibbosus TaxID=931172 RepID=A0AAV6TVR7_9ARAC|nr:hypothetical protein JTE90_013399 [Oedothorax gibbosus]
MTGDGIKDDAFEEEAPRDGQAAKNGRLLLTTALLEYVRRNGEEPQGIRNRAEADIILALREYDAIDQAGYARSQQAANIDIVFNFFLFCRASNIWRPNDQVGSWRRLKRLNIMLYALGQKMQGQQKITDLINQTGGGIEGLLNIFNATNSIYKPPFCLSAHRVYDMVAVFGGIKFNSVPRSFIKCGVSLRYIIHMKLRSATAMELVTTYWTLINAINETLPLAEQNDINEAEHLFHQLLLQKNSAFSNTTNKSGNVFGITLVPDSREQVVANQRTLNEFLAIAGLAAEKSLMVEINRLHI